MSKINWIEARELYVYDERISYQAIADTYGIAKSSVQRHASKNKWQEDRWTFHKDLKKRMGAYNMDKKVRAEERQLEFLRKLQVVMTNGLNSLIRAQNENGELSHAEMKQLYKLSSVASKVIMMERTILGLRNRVIRTNESKESFYHSMEADLLTTEEREKEINKAQFDAKSLRELVNRLEKYRNNG